MKQAFVLVLLFSAGVRFGSAEVASYGSRSAWLKAASNVTNIDLAAAVTTPEGVTLSGVNFSSSKPGEILAVTREANSLTSKSGIQVTLPPGTTAFGFDVVSSVSGNGDGQGRVSIAADGQTIAIAKASDSAFVGFVSSTPISSVTITPVTAHSAVVAAMNFSLRPATTSTAPSVSGLLNAADFSTNLSPGVLAAVFGANFGSGPASSVTVTVGGKQAYVASVSPGQLTIEIPVDAPTGATTLTVTTGGAASNAFAVTLAPFAPAIFTANGSGSGAGLFRTAANVTITSTAPAKPGDALTAYGIGLGATNPSVATGASAAGLAPTTSPVTMTVGGVAVVPSYAGASPGLIGTYQVNFTVPAGLQGTQPVVLTIGGKSSSPVGLPLFGISSVLNNASFGSAGVVAPGSIVSVFANGIGTTSQSTGFPATTFQGVSVSFNGTPAPLFHLTAAQSQIDLLVPFELPTTGTVNVQLKTASATSPNFTLKMAPAAPGMYFLADPGTMGRFNVLAQFNNTVWLAMPASMAMALKIPGNCTASSINPLSLCGQPAAPGDYLVLYTTGLGKATPNGDPNGAQLATGAIPPADGSVLYETVDTPTVTVGGFPAQVTFSGIAPGFPGLYQIDFQVPSGVTGDDVPVSVGISGSPADTRTISVQIR